MARAARTKSATINAVAKHAGVSPSTVSRVMNGNVTVDRDIATRVKASARELDYSPSPLARSLVLGRTMTVAVLVPDLANPTFQSIMRGVSWAAAKDGYRVLVADSIETASEESILAVEVRRRCDALVLCAPRMPEAQLIALTEELAPVVLINRDSPAVVVPIVTADYEAGIRPLAEHLYGLGHRRIAYLEGNPESASNRSRADGLAAFAALRTDAEIVTIPCGVTFEHGHSKADAVLASEATGVLGFNDLVAMGLLSGLHERGIAVPQQVSVTGFDDIPFARYTTPPLTTASVPVVELGELAWKRLHALLEGETPDHNINFRPRLEIRGSTGPVPQ
ncbi:MULTISPECIES: LacI family DNA-binding transcriptional regulator [unclassified Rathayibacter]|uniref:LacI family DNA-binding transcriptional regulator n=1 Tax=unclassified Rathayibacter TaxID=2609250 RepID=UPI000F4B742D|nr:MULTISPECIES: LacI family DNA-binding transcriptional regulator [unclassified Rathayibacter]ROP49141.1 LacI family transcriptional regulator [Rathayibacter sp. PhB186]ROS50742.1 LacI family transcriptional regulator [Rathayibacter sp. PhB185]